MLESLLALAPPLMLLALLLTLLTGMPAVFALIACGMAFGALAVLGGAAPPQLMKALPIRLEFIVANETLLAIPFFTFMGAVLHRSRIAEDMLEVAGQLFGTMRGGLALAAVFIGALMAAATGVVAASVISLALISYPAMVRNGYDPRIASGVVTASGTLTQIVPPSIVLIVVAEQLNMSLGDLYAGVLMPAAILIGLYVLWILVVARLRPQLVPAVAPDAATGSAARSNGLRSVAWLAVSSGLLSAVAMSLYPRLLSAAGRTTAAGMDEKVASSIGFALLAAFLLARTDRALGLRLFSGRAHRVADVLLPPLLLLFAVLGSVFLGMATPTESGSVGALAAVLIALGRRRLDGPSLRTALQDTVRLTCVIMTLLFGATVFSLAFNALDGSRWMLDTLASLPGKATGFLIVVMLAMFVLGMFLDFFELAIVVLPILGPVAEHLGIDKIWFAVLMGINFQASYLTPPFGFALLYFRSAIPDTADLHDAGRPGIATWQIYAGAMPFIAIQVLLMGLVIALPELALGLIQQPVSIDPEQVERMIDRMHSIDENDLKVPPHLDLLPPATR
ncbi:MAG: TRAP transporter large permease subunit [Piscinibacter sp.]|nr:TRAP transporter large permease subunit [Piscinibacter sp.]